jgi:NAD(P)H-nitrite reductase large subunit
MSEIEDRQELSAFIKKRRKKAEITPVVVTKETFVPWYKRPLDKSEFSYKLAKNERYYVRHKEWGRTTWIGPYRTLESVNDVIESYVIESLKTTLDKKVHSNVHSVTIDNPEEFF